jgi:Insertion element 4 transposase N-terminal
MIDAVLEQTRRVRDLPSRVVVCLPLAGCLPADLGYGQVWARLEAGWTGWTPRPGTRPR